MCLACTQVLILKVDVEGHEMAVLQGAAAAIEAGNVPFILVEYGDKMSPAIWDAMKRWHSGAAAAPSPAELPGPSLYALQRWADARGYDAYLLGATHGAPVFVGLAELSHGRTLLHHAADLGRADAVRELLEYAGSRSREYCAMRDERGNTALDLARDGTCAALLRPHDDGAEAK